MANKRYTEGDQRAVDYDNVYAIFNRDGKYEAVHMNWYDKTDDFKPLFTGWVVYDDEHKANRIVHVLNHLGGDYLAITYFIELAQVQTKG